MTDNTDAATLRRAAQVLDNAAAKATQGQPRWHARPDSRGGNCIMPNKQHPQYGGTEPIADLLRRDDAAYIALIDPTVGKAVAAWLHLVSRLLIEGFDENAETQVALAVARALLR